jgi:hypothetical protein
MIDTGELDKAADQYQRTLIFETDNKLSMEEL